jgi:RNA polymerase sigma-70 factor (ECF subfamily)
VIEEIASAEDRRNAGSFAQVVLPHLDAAYNLARWLVRNDADAEDVVQDAYVRALRYFGTFRGGDGRSWLLTIVRNAGYRWLSKNRAEAPMILFDDEIHGTPDDAANPEAMLLQRADGRMLDLAMSQLPVRFREVLVLRELQGLSYREIADVMGVPIGTVMSSLSRARERFRQSVVNLTCRNDEPGIDRSRLGSTEQDQPVSAREEEVLTT